MPGYVPGHPHHRMFYGAPYMSYPRPFMRYAPASRPSFYSSDMYSAEYKSPKERLDFKFLMNIVKYVLQRV